MALAARRDVLMAVQRDWYDVAVWRKSSASADSGNCVEVAAWCSSVLVRDSRNRAGGVLEVTGDQWRAFLEQVRGEVKR
jgi:hypothetical protein